MYRKLVFQTTWRLAVSAILPFLLIGGLVVSGAVERSRVDLARYLEQTHAAAMRCAEAKAKGLLEKDPGGNPSVEYAVKLMAYCSEPPKPTGVLANIFKNIEPFAVWIASSVSIFLILTSISLYIREKVTGWKRLSVVVASALGLVSFLTALMFESSHGVESAVIALLSSAAAFTIGVLLVLGGRFTTKWVRAGFTDPAEPINQSSPELKSKSTSQEESSAPHRTSISTNGLLKSKRSPKKIFAATGAIVAVLIAMVIGKGVWKEIFQPMFGPKDAQFSEGMLASVAKKINKRLPMMVDKETRLDTTLGGPGRKYTYYYTLVNNSSESVDPQQLQKALGPSVKREACSNKTFKILFENGVVITYSYRGNDSRFITQIDVLPSDCGYRE